LNTWQRGRRWGGKGGAKGRERGKTECEINPKFYKEKYIVRWTIVKELPTKFLKFKQRHSNNEHPKPRFM
jgi:hypothetical protein